MQKLFKALNYGAGIMSNQFFIYAYKLQICGLEILYFGGQFSN